LASRGAVVIDADVIAREVVAPRAPAWQALIDAFGAAVLQPDATLDRAFVAELVFNDRSALRRLNSITHTAIGLSMARQLEDARESPLAVVAIPLFGPHHRAALALDEVWCVRVDPAVARQRLIDSRHMDASDAQRRLDSQMTNEERAALADVVIDNANDEGALRQQIDALLAQRGWLGA
jgi:dephospho-CoA kinase